MAILAVALVQGLSVGPNGVNVECSIAVEDIRRSFDVGPFALNFAFVTIAPDIIAAAKTRCGEEDMGEIEFDLLDTVHLFYPGGSTTL